MNLSNPSKISQYVGYAAGIGTLMVVFMIYTGWTADRLFYNYGPVSAEVKTLAEGMARHGEFHSSGTGFGGLKSDQYERFEQLAKVATDDELEYLLGHYSPAVRLYAFQALIEKPQTAPLKFLDKLTYKLAEIETLEGCKGGRWQVEDKAASLLINRYYDQDGDSLTVISLTKLDEFMLYHGSFHINRGFSLLRIGHLPEHYARSRELAYGEHHALAIVALAKAGKSEDQSLIKERYWADDFTRAMLEREGFSF